MKLERYFFLLLLQNNTEENMGGLDKPPHPVRGHLTYYISPLNQRLFKGFVTNFPAAAWKKTWAARHALPGLLVFIFAYDTTLSLKEANERSHLPHFDH